MWEWVDYIYNIRLHDVKIREDINFLYSSLSIINYSQWDTGRDWHMTYHLTDLDPFPMKKFTLTAGGIVVDSLVNQMVFTNSITELRVTFTNI